MKKQLCQAVLLFASMMNIQTLYASGLNMSLQNTCTMQLNQLEVVAGGQNTGVPFPNNSNIVQVPVNQGTMVKVKAKATYCETQCQQGFSNTPTCVQDCNANVPIIGQQTPAANNGYFNVICK